MEPIWNNIGRTLLSPLLVKSGTKPRLSVTLVREAMKGFYNTSSITCVRSFFSKYPTNRCTISVLNTAKVGMLITPYAAAVFWLLSTFILPLSIDPHIRPPQLHNWDDHPTSRTRVPKSTNTGLWTPALLSECARSRPKRSTHICHSSGLSRRPC